VSYTTCGGSLAEGCSAISRIGTRTDGLRSPETYIFWPPGIGPVVTLNSRGSMESINPSLVRKRDAAVRYIGACGFGEGARQCGRRFASLFPTPE
jgi:hypothetical protein